MLSLFFWFSVETKSGVPVIDFCLFSILAVISNRIDTEDMPHKYNFEIDHPFIFYISFKKEPVFLGRLNTP